MRLMIFATIPVVLLTNYSYSPTSKPQDGAYQQVVLREHRRVPGIELDTYTLISDRVEAHRREAEALMRVKLDWPRAMQTKERALFKRILARNFTLREPDGTLYERDAYIRARVESPETVRSVRYENVVVQFFGELAIVSYRNVVRHTDAAGTPDTLHLNWVDVFVREQGEWKIGASHLIGERVEKAGQ
jgi:Domain of unknown function (DUF4440)